MSIKINGSDIIDNTGHVLNVSSITFSDATVQDTGDVGGTPVGNIAKASETLIHILDNPNAYSTSFQDYFGYSVAIDGNYAIVSAYQEDDPIAQGTNSGKVYVFDVSTGALLHTLNNPTAYGDSGSDNFGWSVAISGNYAIVGARYEDQSGGGSSGKAYIFNVTTGVLIHTLDNPNAYSTSLNDYFGTSVAISGNYCIVGALYEDYAGGIDSGKAYIFDVATGTLVHTLDNPNAYSTPANDLFGDSVAISGNYAIVGAYQEDGFGGASSGTVYVFNVTTGALIRTISNPNAFSTSAGDLFGSSVAISGNYCIVGAYNEDDASSNNNGKAYIFNMVTGAQLHTLDNPNAFSTTGADNFGYSVAISGNYAVVSAYVEDDADGTSSGKVYIFNVTTGRLVYTLDNPNAFSTSAGDLFGFSVSISGNYVIGSAYTEDDATGSSSGKAYIFNLDEVSDGAFIEEVQFTSGYTMNFKNDKIFKTAHFGGELTRTLDNPNAFSTSANDQFGDSVAISGNYAIVGALYEDDTLGTGSGKAYIFDVTTGILLHTLDNPNPYGTSTNDSFGDSVAISDNYAIVGAYNEDDTVGSNNGKAYIFNVTTGALIHTLDNPNAHSTSSDDYFGYSVAIDGNYAIVGAYAEDDAGGNNSGKAYIFNVTTGALVHTLDNPNAYSTSVTDRFGYSVAMSGNYAIVGAYQEDDTGGTNSGKAYIFNVLTGALVKTLDNPNPSAGHLFGNSVSISGNYCIVGAPYYTDLSINSGKAYIFDIAAGALVHTLDNPNAFSTASNDFFGYSVAISGNYAIASAYTEDDASGIDSGKAYIFNVTTGALVHTLDNPNAYSTTATDRFGWSVAISGNYCIASAPFEDDAGGGESGKAYIFATRDLTYLDKIVSLAGTI